MSRKNRQQSSKTRPGQQQQHLAERKLEGEDCSSLQTVPRLINLHNYK